MTEHSTPPAFDFASEFRGAHRTLWLIAVGIVWNHADADDVIQEAAMVAVRKLDTFQPGTNFRAWIAEIVRNVALNHRRHVRRRERRFGPRTDFHAVEAMPARSKPESPVAVDGSLRPAQEAIDDRVMKALRQLDPVVRACVLLRCVDNLGYAEISRLLTIPPGTAMSHVYRGRGLLAASLSQPESTQR